MTTLFNRIKPLVVGALWFLTDSAFAQTGMPIVNMVDNGSGGTEYSLTLQLLALMTVLTLLPSLILMMTSFVRIIIVLSLLRQALGTAQTPPNQVLLGLALFLTIFIMSPVISTVYDEAVEPYSEGAISFDAALVAAEKPVRRFMLNEYDCLKARLSFGRRDSEEGKKYCMVPTYRRQTWIICICRMNLIHLQ